VKIIFVDDLTLVIYTFMFDFSKLSLPSSIAQLKKLRTLLLHGNQLTTLPPQIIALKELMEVRVAKIIKILTRN